MTRRKQLPPITADSAVDAVGEGENQSQKYRAQQMETKWWKPKTRRRNLIRAAALLIAEIERLDRARDGEIARDVKDVADV